MGLLIRLIRTPIGKLTECLVHYMMEGSLSIVATHPIVHHSNSSRVGTVGGWWDQNKNLQIYKRNRDK